MPLRKSKNRHDAPRRVRRAMANRLSRRRILARSIDLSWESLRSHLAAAVRCNRADGGNEEFHARAVRDYAFITQALSVELHELTRIDFREKFTAGIRPNP